MYKISIKFLPQEKRIVTGMYNIIQYNYIYTEMNEVEGISKINK